MQDHNTDLDLILQVQKGDKEAFNFLVLRYQFKVIKLVSRYVKDPSEANDIAQEAFIKAYCALDKFRQDSTFYTWLYRIVINTAKNHVTSRARYHVEVDLEFLDLEKNVYKNSTRDLITPEKFLLKEEIEYAVYDAISHLPKELKTAITLREIDGLSYEEISGVMCCPVGTVRSRIFRAREAIEKWLKRYIE